MPKPKTLQSKLKPSKTNKIQTDKTSLRLNLLSIAGRARLLILRLEESERLQELGEKLLVFPYGSCGLVAAGSHPARNKLRLCL